MNETIFYHSFFKALMFVALIHIMLLGLNLIILNSKGYATAITELLSDIRLFCKTAPNPVNFSLLGRPLDKERETHFFLDGKFCQK